jgi:hypothetical protein
VTENVPLKRCKCRLLNPGRLHWPALVGPTNRPFFLSSWIRVGPLGVFPAHAPGSRFIRGCSSCPAQASQLSIVGGVAPGVGGRGPRMRVLGKVPWQGTSTYLPNLNARALLTLNKFLHLPVHARTGSTIGSTTAARDQGA